jgi:type IX secretion system substrate protein
MIDIIKDLLGIIDPESPDPPEEPEEPEIPVNISLNVFPNPSNSEFTFKIESNLEIVNPQLLELDIYNSIGQNVYSFSKLSGINSYTFDLSHLPSNTYFVSINWADRHFHKKIILLK